MIALLPWVLPSVDEGPVALLLLLLLGVEGGDNGPALGDHSPMREAKAFMGLCWAVAAMVFIDGLMVVLRVIELGSKGWCLLVVGRGRGKIDGTKSYSNCKKGLIQI